MEPVSRGGAQLELGGGTNQATTFCKDLGSFKEVWRASPQKISRFWYKFSGFWRQSRRIFRRNGDLL